jgi:serine/threonine protein kinase
MEVGDEMKEEEEDDTIETSYNNVQKKPKNQKTKEISQININEESSKYNKININKESENNRESNEIIENISLINIDQEKEKNNLKNKEELENMNKINIEKDTEDEDIDDNLKIDDYLFKENPKYNKEYTDNDDDLHSRRLTVRDNNDDYLVAKDDTKNDDVLGNYKNDEDENEINEEDEKLFPFKIVGDGKKKGETLGKYNSRYFEIDSAKGLFKRYSSSKEYPKNPKAVIDIRDFTLIKKQRLSKDYHDLEITYVESNKKGKKKEKIENYRFRHQQCRNKWFDSLLELWKALIKGESMPKITKNILSFVDDRLGIVQEIGRGNKNKNKKEFKIDLKKFKILSLLGVGGFGTVFKVRHILTGKIYAMKVMNKNYIIKKKYLHYVVSEFEIMKSLSGFPFVLDLHYCFQSANYLYLIIDLCPNGDFTKLESINNVKLFFAEVVLAFEYIHNKGVIYRDLKPENILLDESGHIKLCDFNLAKSGMNRNKRANSFCGSPLYFSPEMVDAKGVTYKCDVYGIGLLMYEMVVGNSAYTAKNIKELYEKIRKNQINFNVPQLQGDIKDLLLKMLKKDPDERIYLDEVKKHPYFSDIDFDKVLKKEYGKIITVKKSKNDNKKKQKKEEKEKELTPKEKEDLEYQKFMKQQKILDEDKNITVLTGKITLKEMKLDQGRMMKNKVRQFYFVKKEDIAQTQEFQLEINGDKDISNLIIDQQF